MAPIQPKISICIPQWEVPRYLCICLRSIRKHSRNYDLQVIVVDNGSRDASIDYLRSLDWIHLIERPNESRSNWPANFFTALDCGLREATGDYFVTMHTDVFVKRDTWLDPFIRELSRSEDIAASGAWKLELQHPLYLLQKRLFGYLTYKIKRALGGRKRHIVWKQGDYPRDYCAMYRRRILLENNITFTSVNGSTGGGSSCARQIFSAGYKAGLFPVHEMAENLIHVTHGTAAVRQDHPLRHQHAQKKAERCVARLLAEPWVRALEADTLLDAPQHEFLAAA